MRAGKNVFFGKGGLVALRSVAAAVCIAACGARAASLVSVSSDGATVEYATLAAALAACSGGETVTLLGNVTLNESLEIAKPVTIDLGGYKVSGIGHMLKPVAAADGLFIKNGALHSSDCCIVAQGGTYAIAVSNVAFTGKCILFGYGGTLEFLDGCVARCDYLASQFSNTACGMNVRGGVVAPLKSIFDGDRVGTTLQVYGGRFTHDPAPYLAVGYMVEEETYVADGVECAYRVRASTADDKRVASVTSADGAATTAFGTFGEAFNAVEEGGTLTLLDDCPIATTLTISKGFTFDLGGHALTLGVKTDLFNVKSGVSDFTVRNGTCVAPGKSIFYVPFGGSTVTVHEVVCTGGYFATGKATAHATFASGKMLCSYLTSFSSSLSIDVLGGVVAPQVDVHDGTSTKAGVSVSGGRHSANVTQWLADGCSLVCEDAVVDGIACRYVVLPTEEAGAQPAAATISADGVTTNSYGDFASAISACEKGGTVRLLQDCTYSGSGLSVPRDMTIDLNGLRVANTGRDFLSVAADTTVWVKDGVLYGGGSIFTAAAGATVNATNCVFTGLCPFYSGGRGTLNVYDSDMREIGIFGSANGNGVMNVYGGFFTFKNGWRDGSKLGTTFNVHGGHFKVNPATASTPVLAEGARVLYAPVTHRGETYANEVVSAEKGATMTFEAEIGQLYYTNLNVALSVAANGATVRMATNVSHSVSCTDAAVKTTTLDLGGYEIAYDMDIVSVGQNWTLKVKNGTIRQLAATKSCFAMNNDSTLELGPTVSLLGVEGQKACAVYISGRNARVVVDGSFVDLARLVSWTSTGTNAAIVVKGDGTNLCSAVFWEPNQFIVAQPEASTFTVEGGRWTFDPSAYVTNNFVTFHKPAAAPCPWRVVDWTKATADGLAFDFADSMLGASVSGSVDAAGSVVVSLVGTPPTKRTLLADFSGVSAASGALSFTRSPDIPGSVCLEFSNGKLYAWEPKGTLIVFR